MGKSVRTVQAPQASSSDTQNYAHPESVPPDLRRRKSTRNELTEGQISAKAMAMPGNANTSPWGYLITDDKKAKPLLKSLYRAIVNHIVSLKSCALPSFRISPYVGARVGSFGACNAVTTEKMYNANRAHWSG